MDLGHFSVIPLEIIEKIFSYLSWADLTRCSQTFEGIQAIAVRIRDRNATRKLEQDFGKICHHAIRNSRLPLNELQHSLSLWPKVHLAEPSIKASEPLEEEYHNAREDKIKHLQILKGGVIGYAQFTETHEDGSYSLASSRSFSKLNAISYYYSATLKKINFEKIPFDFQYYKENDYIRVLIQEKGYEENRNSFWLLHVLFKENYLKYEINMVDNSYNRCKTEAQFFIVEKKLFFINGDMLNMAKQITKNDYTTLEVSAIANIRETFGSILTIVHINEEQVNLLTRNGKIYSIVDKKMEFRRKVDIEDTDRTVACSTLTDYGFDWSAHDVYRWIGTQERIGGKWVGITHLKNATVFCYGKVVIIGTCHRTLHVYVNPYKDGVIKLYNRRPTMHINLRLFKECQLYADDRMASHHRKIIQIDVIEIKNGHRIVMLYCQKIITVELTH